MGYKLNIRNAGNTAWVNLLQAEYISVTDTNGYFTASDVEGILDEIFENKADRVESASAPTVSDDSSDGYQTGTVWVNTASDTVYVLVDATVGSAIWMDVSSLETEDIEDIVGAMVSGNNESGITVTYDSGAGKLDFAVATATDSVLGIASFSNADFDVTAGAVSIKDNSITVDYLAHDIDATSIGFDSDKVDGRDVDDSGSSTDDLWTAAKIINYVDQFSIGLDWQDSVLDKDLDAPPGTPGNGDRYLVSYPSAAATGAWAGHDNELAEWDGSAWVFTALSEGMAMWIEDEDVVYTWNGSEWVKMSSTQQHNNSAGLQGGNATDEFYHLTNAEHTSITGSKTANTFFAAPNGSTGVGSFRAMVADDVPMLLTSKITAFTEDVQDVVGGMVSGNSETNITVTYDDGNGKLGFSIAEATTSTLGVASFVTSDFTVVGGAVTIKEAGIDHGLVSGLADDDHTQYMHNTIARTVSAVHTFNPGSATAPFILGSNGQGQL
ncbi:MAG: DUF2793 domain-containing protein, partial [Candidatus Heimdallarchaeota archaeon]